MIEHLKSGLSISTHMGCELNCKYCVLSTMNGFNKGAVLQISPENLIDELLNNCDYFKNGETPLMINNRTEPFLPTVLPYTIKILDLLIQNNIISPVIIISKFAPPKVLKNYFNKLKIMYFYSYSGIKTDFNYNKISTDLKIIKSIVPQNSRFHYFRPIIPGMNDDIVFMKRIINKFKNSNFCASIITGFRVTELNKHLIKDESIIIEDIDHSHKLIDSSIYDILANKEYDIFRHTSCAIANFLHSYNKLKYFNRKGHCINTCPNYKTCSKKNISIQYILSELNEQFKGQYQFNVNDNKIEVMNECDQELIAFIKNAFGCEVIAKNLKLSKSEEVILGAK